MHVFILLPSLSPTGPVKGAYALANGLCKKTSVSIVTLKKGVGVDAPLDRSIKLIELAHLNNLYEKLNAFRALLKVSKINQNKPVVISFCFSADFVSFFCKDLAVICSSVRSNLIANYRMDYGVKGIFLALLHYVLLNRFDRVVAMTEAMARQIQIFLLKTPVIIGNFIDEQAIEAYREESISSGSYRVTFLGSVSARKKPLLLIKAVSELIANGIDIKLDILGGGPLEAELKSFTDRLNIQQSIKFHGHLKNPYNVLSKADLMVLPSLSEGLSRATLEALHLGVPCILRNVDGNAELIELGFNGHLFEDENELSAIILKMLQWSRSRTSRSNSLLPEKYRQAYATDKYYHLINNH